MRPRNSCRSGVIGVNRKQAMGDQTADHPGHETIRHRMMINLASWARIVQHPLGRICSAHLVFPGLTSVAPLSCRQRGTLALPPHLPRRLPGTLTDQPRLETCKLARVARTQRRRSRLLSPRYHPCRPLGPLGSPHRPMLGPTALELAHQRPWLPHLVGPLPLQLLDSA